MNHSITFSRTKFENFLACQRRFQLRYLDQLPWPYTPLTPEQELGIERGEQFHQLVERHFLAMSTPPAVLDQMDPLVQRWWRAFLQHGPKSKESEIALTETTLTVTLGEHSLLGRFDLIILGEGAAHIYDWKTGEPRSVGELKADWQTRLYLALLVEGNAAYALPKLSPDQMKITYWYARQPEASQTIAYSEDEHAASWAEIQRIVTAVSEKLANPSTAWPLTSDLLECGRCAYQNYCGRFEAPRLVSEILAEREDEYEEAIPLEPELPDA